MEQWVRHGLDLPQYVPAFTAHSISVSDFPLLIADDAAALREELQVGSKLHRAKIVRAIQRLILGLGSVPSPPSDVSCRPVTASAGTPLCDQPDSSVLLTWQQPDVEVPLSTPTSDFVFKTT